MNSINDYVVDLIKRLYAYILLSLFCVMGIYFSITSLIMSIANKLDEGGVFFWMKSMTIYSIIAILSSIFFYYLNTRNYISKKTESSEIKAIIKKYNKQLKTRKL